MRFAGDALEAAWGDGAGCGLMAMLGADHFIGATPGRNQQFFNGTLFLLWRFILRLYSWGSVCPWSAFVLLAVYLQARARVTGGFKLENFLRWCFLVYYSWETPPAWCVQGSGCGAGSPRVLGTHTSAVQCFESCAKLWRLPRRAGNTLELLLRAVWGGPSRVVAGAPLSASLAAW